MSNVKETFSNKLGVQGYINAMFTDPTLTVTKLDVRLVGGGYKLIATVYRDDEQAD